MNVKDYEKGLINYTFSEEKGFFEHNLNQDYQMFIVWEKGRNFEDVIVKEIKQKFDIISAVRIQWSDKNIAQNFNRFYKAFNNPHISAKAETMGRDEFLCIIVEDKKPEYYYRQSMSGNIELVNTRAIDVKRDFRELCDGNYLHSSTSPEEFFEQAFLLFGENLLQEILDLKHAELTLHQDLVGANGWSDFSELFNALKYTSKYLVMRNFEFLPFDFYNNDKDIDILCKNALDFISGANAEVLSLTAGGAKLIIEVEKQKIPIDLRFVGDGYYDTKWETDMLDQRVKTLQNIYKPRIDHYFFALLYHAIFQKPEIKPVYHERFKDMAKELQFDFFDVSKVNNKKYIAELFKGFLTAQNYLYTRPKDPEVYINYKALKYLPENLGGGDKQRMYRFVKTFMPQRFIEIIPENIKEKVRKIVK